MAAAFGVKLNLALRGDRGCAPVGMRRTKGIYRVCVLATWPRKLWFWCRDIADIITGGLAIFSILALLSSLTTSHVNFHSALLDTDH